MKWLILMTACMVASVAYADIYKSVDATGQVTYTDHPIKGAHRMNLGPMPAPRVLTGTAGHKASSVKSNNPGSGGFPRVDAATQQKRDTVRHTILQSELNSEEQALKESLAVKNSAEKLHPGELASSPSYLDRLEKLNETVKLHNDNIKALQKELGSLK
ncbi:MAG TPA: DUF4124 domain-containing protein [Burkholderiales bacterium]|nr:DUF4124 domain-containing protein [Burkholderiales bacterium]